MVYVRTSIGGSMAELTDAEEAEAQNLLSKAVERGNVAQYSNYASSENVRNRLIYLFNQPYALQQYWSENPKAIDPTLGEEVHNAGWVTNQKIIAAYNKSQNIPATNLSPIKSNVEVIGGKQYPLPPGMKLGKGPRPKVVFIPYKPSIRNNANIIEGKKNIFNINVIKSSQTLNRALGEVLKKRTLDQKSIQQLYLLAYRAEQKGIKIANNIYNNPKFQKALNLAINVYDFASAGKATQRKIAKQQEAINRQVAEFNKAYGDRELSESEYNRARYIASQIVKQQRELDNKTKKLEEKYPTRTSIRKQTEREEAAEKLLQMKSAKQLLKEGQLPALVRKSFNFAGEKFVSGTELLRVDLLKLGKNKMSAEQKKVAGKSLGEAFMFAGFAPFMKTRVQIAKELYPQKLNVKFAGEQYKKNGKVVTDIVFTDGKGKIVGYAKGVSKKGISTVAGGTGKIAVRFPSGKIKMVKVKGFVGYEESLGKMRPSVKVKKIHFGKNFVKKVVKIKDNLNVMARSSRGKVFKVSGKKYFTSGEVGGFKFTKEGIVFPTGQRYGGMPREVTFPSGKVVKIGRGGITKLTNKIKFKPTKGIDYETFSAITKQFTRNDISHIVGNAITNKNKLVAFDGWIKGTKSAGTKSFSIGRGGQGLQYRKALTKVMGAVATAVAQTQKVKSIVPLTRTASTAVTAAIIKEVSKSPGNVKEKIANLSMAKVLDIAKENVPESPKVILSESPSSRSSSRSGEKSLTQQITKEKQKEIEQQKPLQPTAQKPRSRTRQRYKTPQRTQQKLKLKSPTFTPVPPPASRVKFKAAWRRKKKKKLSKKKSKPVAVFNVYGKSGKKFVKLNSMPLAKADALSRGAYVIDNTTSRTFKIVPAGKKKKKAGALRKAEQNYFKRAGYKLREYKIKKGRKFALKKKYIEKRKYGIDTRGEKKGLSIARFLKKNKIKKTRRSKTKIKRHKIKRRFHHKSNFIKRRTLKKKVYHIRPVGIRRARPVKVKRKIKRLRRARRVRRPIARRKPLHARHPVIKVRRRRRIAKRRISPAQRKILIARLKKARRVLASQRRKRRHRK